jgi:hypothetical protein
LRFSQHAHSLPDSPLSRNCSVALFGGNSTDPRISVSHARRSKGLSVTPITHRRPLAALSEIRRSAALVHFRVVISMGATRSWQFVEIQGRSSETPEVASRPGFTTKTLKEEDLFSVYFDSRTTSLSGMTSRCACGTTATSVFRPSNPEAWLTLLNAANGSRRLRATFLTCAARILPTAPRGPSPYIPPR